MIGVVVSGIEREAVEEFFQLFKTPWKWAPDDHQKYRVLAANGPVDEGRLEGSGLLILSSPERVPLDERIGLTHRSTAPQGEVEFEGAVFPVASRLAVFGAPESANVLATCRGEPACVWIGWNGLNVVRLGFDLFREAAQLLSFPGQPPENAAVPTLDQQIGLLRSIIRQVGLPLVEIPPVPDGADFFCCLTHDIDFCGIRRHKFDRTAAGFLYRALLATPLRVLQGQRSAAQALANCKAALSLPFVYLGLLPDLWQPFQSYLQAEAGLPSTFFVVPFKGHPGERSPQGAVEPRRAVAYQAEEVSQDLADVLQKDCEVAVHGLDAWADTEAGRRERQRIEEAAGRPARGVRMHWLYFDKDSPRNLEEAGFDYDSTWGYNDAAGYRAGTSQVFRWMSTRGLLELPLLIQDTSLFYPDRMGLDEEAAWAACERMIDHAVTHGGTVVVNWHDRSLAPERQWDRFHRRLLERLVQCRPCFRTAAQTVEWFRARRNIRFEGQTGETIRQSRSLAVQPSAVLRRWRPAESSACDSPLSE